MPITEKKNTLLLVDDNEVFLKLFLTLPEAAEYHVVTRISAESGLAFLAKNAVDVIISDVQMPEMDGIALFGKVQDLYPEIPMILITSFGSTQEAIMAVKRGAFHYFEKPLENKLPLFWATVREAITKGALLREKAVLSREKSLRSVSKTPIIGTSPGICRVLQQIQEVADLDVTVLIQGETGTGKELVAQAIHDQGNRSECPYFAISCTEFAEGVLESELFGHEKGAFTGAIAQKKGLFEIVHNGTIFLDEISEAPAPMQAKLLRVLGNHTVKRIGGVESLLLTFRLVTATNRDLDKEVKAGRFRQDLIYRLNAYVITVPPLRERKEDIPLIAEFYLKKFSKNYKKQITGFTENAMLSLWEYPWPGNVRELINVVERAVITCKGSLINTTTLPFNEPERTPVSDLSLTGMEKYCIRRALHRTDNNRHKAAQLLGIARKTLIAKIKKYRLE